MPFGKETKAIKHIQNMSHETEAMHEDIASSIESLKNRLAQLDSYEEIVNSAEYKNAVKQKLAEQVCSIPLEHKSFKDIAVEADKMISGRVKLGDILDDQDIEHWNARINMHIRDFNKEHSLDAWDYAIAGSCGLFTAMLDWFCVRPPLKPTAKFDTQVNGIFNQASQKLFNKFLPPDVSKGLSEQFKIGTADTSTRTKADLKGYGGRLTPYNHRFIELSHDPILGLIFGALDIIHNTCTIVENGKIVSYPGKNNNFEGNFFHAMGKMLGHLASDINAPSGSGGRGMGLPAPFMGMAGMFKDTKLFGQDISKTAEYMYLKGYDMRQFVATSIPLAIMEVMLRAFFIIKEIKLNDSTFADALKKTIPTNMSKKFRMMVAISYGVTCSINAGRVYITKDILNLNYSAWIGLVWNGFHALKWALVEKQFALWNFVEARELKQLEKSIEEIEKLEQSISFLPI